MKEEKFQRLIDSILLRYRAHIEAIFFFFFFIQQREIYVTSRRVNIGFKYHVITCRN